MEIPLYKPTILEEDIGCVVNSLRSGHLTRYEETEKLETEFASFVGRKYATAVNSGTTALFLSIKASGIGKGDRVITSPFSYIATTNAILYCGAVPVFFDIDKDTHNLDFGLVDQASLENVKGVVLPHIFGETAELEKFKQITKSSKNLVVIEDACEALTPSSGKLSVGKFSKTSVYSFHENKTITGGEGGIIATDNEDIYNSCMSLRDQGRSNDKNWLDKTILGYNFRITEMQASLISSQLNRFTRIHNRLLEVSKMYYSDLANCDQIQLPSNLDNRAWVIFYVLIPDQDLREVLMKRLEQFGISTASHYFVPIYKFGHVRQVLGDQHNYCPITEEISSRTLALPFYESMTREEVSYVCDSIKSILSSK